MADVQVMAPQSRALKQSAPSTALLTSLSQLCGRKLSFAHKLLLDNPSIDMMNTSTPAHELLECLLQSSSYYTGKKREQLHQAIERSERQRRIQFDSYAKDVFERSFRAAPTSWEVQPGRRPMYICIGEDSVILVNVDSVDLYPVPVVITLQDLDKLVVSDSDALVFGIVTRCPVELEGGKANIQYLRFICRQRQTVLDAIQVSWRTRFMKTTFSMGSLAQDFINMESVVPEIEFDEEREGDTGSELRRFFRAGYTFKADVHFVDKNESLPNRHYSTYVFTPTEGEAAEKKNIPLCRQPHLLVRIEPKRKRESNDMRHITSDQSLRLWIETLAHAISRHEAGDDGNYLVLENVPLKKKSSPDSFWKAYRLSVSTADRSICFIGLRRHFLPPLGDCYQDMAFIYMDTKLKSTELQKSVLDRSSSSILAAIVASLQTVDACKCLSEECLPIYDMALLQAQADTYSTDSETLRWLRKDLSIEPSQHLLGVQWRHLRFAFCGAIIRLLPLFGKVDKRDREPHSQTEEQDVKWQRIRELGFVDDPLSIATQVETEILDNQKAITSPHAGVPGVSQNNPSSASSFMYLDDVPTQSPILTRDGISTRFADALNRGENSNLPIDISIQTICEYAHSESCTNGAALHRIIDYVLHARSRGKDFTQDPSILQKLQNEDFLADFVCNEIVAIEMLSPNTCYIEKLDSGDGHRVLCNFLRALLRKNYNLDLMRAVCTKIVSTRISELDAPTWMPLLPPLTALLERGNIYVQSWACEALAALTKCQGIGVELLKESDALKLACKSLNTSNDSQLIQTSVRLLANLIPLSTHFEGLCNEVVNPLGRLLCPVVRGQRMNAAVCNEVVILLTILSTQEGNRGTYARETFLDKGFVDMLMYFLSNHRDYLPVVNNMAACLGCLFYKCPKNHKNRSIGQVPVLCRLLLEATDSNRRSLILQILRNLSCKSFPVLKVMRKQGIDKLLQAFEDAASAQRSVLKDPKQIDMLAKELRLISLLQGRVSRRPRVQICVLMEVGRGMGPWLRRIDLCLNQMVETTELGLQGDLAAEVRTSFVSYRITPGKIRGFGFEPVKATIARASSLKAFGSTHGASDLLNAMLYSLENFVWDGDIRIMAIICSNPCFGREFHSAGIADAHPNRVYGTDKLTAADVLEDVSLSGIDLAVEALNGNTDMMIDAFRKHIGPNRVTMLPDLDFDHVEDRIKVFSQAIARTAIQKLRLEFS